MKVKKWQRKIWWLARYFELAVPMTFMLYLGSGMALIGRGKMSVWLVMAAMIGLVYMAALRGMVEATWRWQALDWLMGISHHLTSDETAQLKMWIEKSELKVCRAWMLILATVLTVLAFSQLPVWSVVSRAVIAVVVGVLILSHFLKARMQMRDEMTEIRHSS